MLPGISSKKNKIDQHKVGGKNKIKKQFHHDDDELNEIILQYNLEKMSKEQQYNFSYCDINRDTYPFVSSLSKNIDDILLFDSVETQPHSEEDDESDKHRYDTDRNEIQICIYQINTSCKVPFIEYLMVHSNEKDGKIVFEFPKIEYTLSKRKSVEKQAEEYAVKVLKLYNNRNDRNDNKYRDEDEYRYDDVIKFRGVFKPPKDSSSLGVYFFFQKCFKKDKHPPQLSKRDHVWWVLASEIANFKRVMYMEIDPSVNKLFIKNPEIMHLYDCKGRLLETPTVCYFGDEFQKIKYLAFFGLLKAPVKSSFGPFYVATNFLSSMKYACYTHNQEPFELYTGEKITIGEYGKYKEGGVLRMILFVGKMKVFLRDGQPDESQISQELAKIDKTIENFLSLRDSNGNWTEEYDTAYKGLHFGSVNGSVVVNPVEWFFKDYSNSVVISYHNIDTANIPEKFDVDYVDYKLK